MLKRRGESWGGGTRGHKLGHGKLIGLDATSAYAVKNSFGAVL